MKADTRSYISAFSLCTQNKSSPKPSSGLLRPLPLPSRPWFHIALDFVTGLPPSNGKTFMLTIIGRFSKAAHFLALPKLPSARGLTDLVEHVFRLHGLLSDIVSDRVPQFTSQVWKAFSESGLLPSKFSHSGSHNQPFLRLPSPDQQPSRESQSGDGGCTPLCHLF